MEYVIIRYRLKDGRDVPFNHPDAYKERLEAIKGWKISPKLAAVIEKQYDDAFARPVE